MSTTTRSNISELRHEVKLLRSFVIGLVGRDPEGNYRPDFVRDIIRAAREKPRYRFEGAKSFLARVRRSRLA